MDKEQLTIEVKETNDEVQSVELENEKNETKRKPRTQRSFPQYSIEECLIIAKSIATNNSGNPWSPEQIANSMNLSTKTKRFIYLTYASRDYGLTTGTKSTETIELTALGRKAVFPKDQTEEREALDKAFKNIDVFKQVNEYYQKGGLPEKRFCSSVKKKAKLNRPNRINRQEGAKKEPNFCTNFQSRQAKGNRSDCECGPCCKKRRCIQRPACKPAESPLS